MRALLHRALIAFTGMPDEGCTGSCDQGRCNCDCELANAVAPDPERTFSVPMRARRERAFDAVIAVMAMALLAFGVWVFPH